jgi:hypothetical protein
MFNADLLDDIPMICHMPQHSHFLLQDLGPRCQDVVSIVGNGLISLIFLTEIGSLSSAWS